ncbi:MAG: hypothetical protein ABF824_13095 [Acetobacter sp.]
MRDQAAEGVSKQAIFDAWAKENADTLAKMTRADRSAAKRAKWAEITKATKTAPRMTRAERKRWRRIDRALQAQIRGMTPDQAERHLAEWRKQNATELHTTHAGA